ncbi:hypothetical protein BDY19DRAFT_908640 [Irpex rosettiformis]|uniref:Uncharacterized protein n=1 Tax=Irpex rosettiformis TaxID=378272 RepID=A0ACB8TUY9_9APHY|nr:hypothetical protein BDY19DRAFT_908640 [Irpex rosettiformis]
MGYNKPLRTSGETCLRLGRGCGGFLTIRVAVTGDDDNVRCFERVQERFTLNIAANLRVLKKTIPNKFKKRLPPTRLNPESDEAVLNRSMLLLYHAYIHAIDSAHRFPIHAYLKIWALLRTRSEVLVILHIMSAPARVGLSLSESTKAFFKLSRVAGNTTSFALNSLLEILFVGDHKRRPTQGPGA